MRSIFGFGNVTIFLLKWTPSEKQWAKSGEFPVLEGVTFGSVKIWPLEVHFFFFFWVGVNGRLKNSGSNAVTFPFLEWLALGPIKVCPSLGEILARPQLSQELRLWGD